ncbi:tetratricopeptide repeat protein, partial [Synechococcus sp. AH-551-B05]
MTDLVTIQELSAAGRHQECLQACRNVLRVNSEEIYAYKYAGKSLLALGQLEKAQQCLLKAHQLDGSDPEIVKDIGNIFNSLQNDVEAIRLYKAALSIDQNYAPAYNNLGLIAKRQGNLDVAGQLVKKARDLDQLFAPYHLNLGGIYKEIGQLDQALAATLKSLELKPDNADAQMNLGGIYKELGQFDQALAATLKSLELKPDNADAQMNLGGIYKDLGQLDRYLKAIQKYISFTYEQQNFSDPIESILMDQEKLYSFFKASSCKWGSLYLGNYFLAITSICLFERIDAIDWFWIFSMISNDSDVHLPFLHLLPYALSQDDSNALCALSRQVYGDSSRSIEAYGGSIPFIATLNIKSERPAKCLSFGFLSNDTINHSASPFLYAMTSELIKQGHLVNTYSSKLIDCSVNIEASQSSSFISTKAVSLYGLSLEESRSLISNEMHDVLIDAEGLTNDHYNMRLLNRHLVPCQISWLGYPGTTGNSNIDFFLTDKYCKFIDADFFAERALVIDGAMGARYPIIGAPEPGDCPFTKNGYITFGSLNNSYKITSLAIKTWSEIMLQCSHSRFMFFRNCYSSSVLQANISSEFEKNGISSNRISYVDNSKLFASHFDCYNEIDISLDTFPLTGGVTTYDSLWMGVPVITIEGSNMHQRISSSLLRHAGIPE